MVRPLACLLLLAALLAPLAAAGAAEDCPNAPARRLSPVQLAARLHAHALWLERLAQAERDGEAGVSLRAADLGAPANLCRLDLSGAELSGAKLAQASLAGADLTGARLISADLSGADLHEARLGGANLNQALLVRANLTAADLTGATLNWAKLSGATLRESVLTKTSLNWADLTDAQLEAARLDHASLGGAVLTRAVLDQAGASGADLHQAALGGASLDEAELSDADLSGADLGQARLRGSVLVRADLSAAGLLDADLTAADLTGADLAHARLQGARLTDTNLLDAKLVGADLSAADFDGTILTGAKMSGAKLFGASYEPASGPNPSFLGGLAGVRTLRFPPDSQYGLMQLRESLQKAGLRSLEREAIYALQSGLTRHALAGWRRDLGNAIEGAFRWLAFDLTTAYGLHPVRALGFLAGLWLLCIPVYAWAILRSPEQGSLRGIYRVWPRERLDVQDGRPSIDNPPLVEHLHAEPGTALIEAAYFSLLAAFRVGWRELNVGSWIARVQPREYVLQAAGWVRVVAGLQSLLSVYFLALWALTYFSRPFQ